ncbi:unnamed protein product, partial [Heterotrigona itama]
LSIFTYKITGRNCSVMEKFVFSKTFEFFTTFEYCSLLHLLHDVKSCQTFNIEISKLDSSATNKVTIAKTKERRKEMRDS